MPFPAYSAGNLQQINKIFYLSVVNWLRVFGKLQCYEKKKKLGQNSNAIKRFTSKGRYIRMPFRRANSVITSSI